MRIFISYGHNDHTALVDLLFDALLQAGHQPWKDDRYEGSSGIYPGEDFTQVIYDAIDSSDFVVALVSQVTQTKPYCRDERQYAYNNKGSHFIQLRLDHVQLRLGNSQSYIDMSDVETDTGKIDEALFQKQLQALFAAFRDPAAFAENGLNYWAKFEAHLRIPGALKYHEFVGVLDSTPFVGRQWLKEKCIQWVTDSSIDCRLFAILGEAGTGKTAFIRHLASDRELVRSVHVCIYDRPSTRSAKDTLKDLAYILAQNNDAYFNFLKSKNLEPISEMGVDGLFEFLFIEPLKNERDKYLLIIDGLDELEEATGLNPLMKLFRQYATRINPNISFLVTGRPDENILNKLRTIGGGTPPEQVVLDPAANREDLAQYIKQQLGALGQYSPRLAQTLLDACDGNFEYLTLLFREASREGLALTEDMKMPRGLNERYTQYLDRRMEAAGQRPRFTREQRQMLSVLCAAAEPLPLSLLADITGMDSFDIQDEISILGSLIRQAGDDEDPLICLFTKGFRDYLLDRGCSAYCASLDQGNEQIAQFILDRCPGEKQLKKHPYLDRNAYLHLLIYGQWEEEAVCDYLCRQAKDIEIAPRLAAALCQGDPLAAATYCNLQPQVDPMENVVRLLKSLREKIALTQICAYREAHGDGVRALILSGDIDRMDPSPQAFAQAQAHYEEALTLARAQYEREPTCQSRRTLSLCYERLAILAKRQKTAQALALAADYHKKSLSLNEENLAQEPGLRFRRDVAVSCEHLGLLYKQRAERGLAMEYFLRCLELTRENHAQAPGYQSRRDMMFVYRRLAALAEGSRNEEARQWYQKAAAMTEENHRQFPSFESRHDLSVSYDFLGMLAFRVNAREEAKEWFLKANALDRENCEENPCFQSRQDLAVSYTRLANLAVAGATPQAMEEAESWSRLVTPLYAENYEENPCDQTRTSLSDNYRRIAGITVQQQTAEGLADAEACLRQALSLDEETFRQTPDANSAGRVIGVLNQLLSLPRALEAALPLRSRLLEVQREREKKSAPNYYDTEVAAAFCALAELQRKLEDPEKAETTYRAFLDWIQAGAVKPNHALYLSMYYVGMVHVAEAAHTLNGDLEALVYRQKLEALKERFPGLLGTDQPQTQAASPTHARLEALLAQYAKAPTPQLRTELTRLYIRLGVAESGYLEKALALAQEAYDEAPGPDTRNRLALICNYLGGEAKEENTPQGDARAKGWYEKELALEERKQSPDGTVSHHVTLAYRELVELARKAAATDGFAEADRLQQEYLAIYKQAYEQAPTYANWQLLTDVYRELVRYATEKGTPEGTRQAQAWQAIYDELWENCPTKA